VGNAGIGFILFLLSWTFMQFLFAEGVKITLVDCWEPYWLISLLSLLLHPKHGTWGCWQIWNCCGRQTHFVTSWKLLTWVCIRTSGNTLICFVMCCRSS